MRTMPSKRSNETGYAEERRQVKKATDDRRISGASSSSQAFGPNLEGSVADYDLEQLTYQVRTMEARMT